MSTEFSLPPRFEPGTIEEKWIKHWDQHGHFRAGRDLTRKAYTIMIPPPNVTGQLHLGHALNNTLQDVMVRMKRMQGFSALWVPGTDHAGIATQAVVERKVFEEEGKTRAELGREEFLGRIWKWKDHYENRILEQLRKLGCSCDFTRTRFTMDQGLSKSVLKAFVDMFNKGLIYRAPRIVNWDCALQTAVSDDEINMIPAKGIMATLRYEVKGESGRFIEVATTRPETLFGDTGVAVNPADPRYSDLIGKYVVLPLVGREIPVVADPTVEMDFGTGAVKVTPGHDPSDWERGQRYNLPTVIMLNNDGTLNQNCGEYAGLPREKARKQVLSDLDAFGLLAGVVDHDHTVPQSDRSKTVIEPLVSEQWFVRMRGQDGEPGLVDPAIEAAKSGELRFTPARWSNFYLQWLENVQDWCISRQLWWGHRIPVYYDEDGNHCSAMERPEKHPESGKPIVRQDDDVLDTWFSSALWPFSTLGWPDKTADLDYFYPTDALFTSRDIIYLWVARMVIQGYQFTGHCPFSDVFIHPTILDEHGRRMSKSAGNGVDPLDMVEIYGVDSLRFSLAMLTTDNQDCRLGIERDKNKDGKPGPVKGVRQFENARNFINKLWNACRFALGHVGPLADDLAALPAKQRAKIQQLEVTAPEDRWILSRLAGLVDSVTSALDGPAGNGEGGGFRFHEATQKLYQFTWNEFCDWYLEIVKPRLYDGYGGPESALAARAVLVRVMDVLLRLLHPFSPFVTEEIWGALRPQATALLGGGDREFPASLCVARWPQRQPERIDQAAERSLKRIQDMVRAIRAIRADHEITRKIMLGATISLPSDGSVEPPSEWEQAIIRDLCGIGVLEVGVNLQRPKLAATAVVGSIQVYVPLGELIDPEMERLRLRAKAEKLRGRIEGLGRKLMNTGYLQGAAPETVAETRELHADGLAELERLDAVLSELEAG